MLMSTKTKSGIAFAVRAVGTATLETYTNLLVRLANSMDMHIRRPVLGRSAGPSLEGPSGWEGKKKKSQVNVIVSFIVVIFQESFQHSIHSLM